MTQQTKRKLFALHPDTNGGDHSKVQELTNLLNKCKNLKSPVILAGFRVKARGHWYSVVRTTSEMVKVTRRVPRNGKAVIETISRREVQDIRCGPSFKYRMIRIKI